MAAGEMQEEAAGSKRLGSTLSLRPAALEDSDTLFRLRNDPETRKWALQPELIELPNHEHWLKVMLADKEKIELLIGEFEGRAVGTVRFNLLPSADGDQHYVSITIDPELRRRGFGKLLLEAACLHRRHDNLSAIINKKNDRSIAIFESCGFIEVQQYSDSRFLLFRRGPLLL